MFHSSRSADDDEWRGSPIMNAAPIYDLILRGGHVICPASGIDGIMDVAIADGKIARLGKNILASTTARQITDVRGNLVLPGMIDTHAHIYRYVTGRFGLEADMVGVESGVTALIDQVGSRSHTCPMAP
jgi:dihydroorotase